MAPLNFAVGALGVDGLLEMAQDPPQPRRIQPTGCLQQHRLRLHSDMVGKLVSAMGQRAGMGS
jgi:hypothetical protein